MAKETVTKSNWSGGTREVTKSVTSGGTTKSTHYKETQHAIFPNSIRKTGTSVTKK